MASRLRSSTRASTVASESLADQVVETKSRGETKSRASLAKAPKASELQKLMRIAMLAFIFSSSLIGGIIYFALNDTIKLYPSQIRQDALKGFNSRAEYSIRYQTLLYFWLIISIFNVMYVRVTKKALNPLVDSTEKHAQMQKSMLTNSLEQILISSFLQLGFASFADASLVLKLIPAVNFVQFFGRIAFFFGYPLYRTLGFTLSMSPNLLMLGFNLYKMGAYIGLY